jgi:PAS domain S-box-containing protein
MTNYDDQETVGRNSAGAPDTNDLYRQLFENAQVGLYRSKLDGSAFLMVNQKLAEMFGYSVEEMMSMPSSVLWADQRERDEMVRQIRSSGSLSNFEVRIRAKNGEVLTLLASVKIWPDRGYLEGTAIDITKFKQAEQEYRESTEMWQFIVENSPDYITLLDFDFTVRYINKTVRLSSKTDILGQPVLRYIDEESLPQVRDVLERVRRTGQRDRYEAKIRLPDGSCRFYETRVAQLIRSGKVESLILSSSDVTARKQAEEDLRKFKAISDNARYGSAIADMTGHLVYVNEAFAAMHGYSPRELAGKHLSIFHTPEQMAAVNEFNDTLVLKGGLVGVEVGHVRADGTVFPTLMNGAVIRDDQGAPQFLSATAVDITERKYTDDLLAQTTEQLKIEREALERKNVALSEILAQIDKDKNSLKQRIVTNIEKTIIPTLLRLKETAPPVQRRNFELLGKDLLEITSPFLDVIRTTQARLTPREMETCRMIKNGMSSKEIAQLLKLSAVTVHKYREKIRNKLGLAGKKVNLRVFLESIGEVE